MIMLVEFVVLVALIADPDIADYLEAVFGPLLDALGRPVAALLRFVERTFQELASLLRRGSG
ncbi:hypothetical protein [Curtobacterium sp. VKM Ac-2884]|uniref:hypothetical protein n=1 Tax=Curtobacterium sp. VKM Ac-2884 TaxID=2783818 RepID=UPI001889CBDE|nr:hypothetical protein [Curtobacterium sp. VKM Ac-2884]MBF4603741.1 hypothetical protein [Curtobacterium sp. VKM Ac-2884]